MILTLWMISDYTVTAETVWVAATISTDGAESGHALPTCEDRQTDQAMRLRIMKCCGTGGARTDGVAMRSHGC
jgi:hypothetical protein